MTQGCPLQDVVYAFKPKESAAVSISLCGSAYDTVLALYDRVDDWSAIEEISCNDDSDCGTQSYLPVRLMPCYCSQAVYSFAAIYDAQAGKLPVHLLSAWKPSVCESGIVAEIRTQPCRQGVSQTEF